eukprot:scaffold1418_cov260-Pinguiococcus_pyrenoidosus.AAC.2
MQAGSSSLRLQPQLCRGVPQRSLYWRFFHSLHDVDLLLGGHLLVGSRARGLVSALNSFLKAHHADCDRSVPIRNECKHTDWRENGRWRPSNWGPYAHATMPKNKGVSRRILDAFPASSMTPSEVHEAFCVNNLSWPQPNVVPTPS